MNIFSCFRSARVNDSLNFSGTQVADSGKVLLKCLNSIGNSGEVKCNKKTVKVCDKSKDNIKNIIKHAQNNNFNAAYKDLVKLHKNAQVLLSSINNVYNKDVIEYTSLHLNNIIHMVCDNKSNMG